MKYTLQQETFEGENLCDFRSFVAVRESLLCEILWHSVLWCKQFAKGFSTKIGIFTNSRKFSPLKVFRYTVSRTPSSLSKTSRMKNKFRSLMKAWTQLWWWYLFTCCADDVCLLLVLMMFVYLCWWCLFTCCADDICLLVVLMTFVYLLCWWRLFTCCADEICLLVVLMTFVYLLCWWCLFTCCAGEGSGQRRSWRHAMSKGMAVHCWHG